MSYKVVRWKILFYIGIPVPEVKWYKDDHKLKPNKDKRITMDFDVKQDLHILTIHDAVIADEGTYKLKVQNEKGTASVCVMVTAKVPGEPEKKKGTAPTFKSLPQPVNVSAGETIRLTCGVTG